MSRSCNCSSSCRAPRLTALRCTSREPKPGFLPARSAAPAEALSSSDVGTGGGLHPAGDQLPVRPSGRQPQFHKGLRVTDALATEVVVAILSRKVNKSLFPSSTAARTRESLLMARDDDHWVIDDASHERPEVVMLLLVKCGRRHKAMWNQMKHQLEMGSGDSKVGITRSTERARKIPPHHEVSLLGVVYFR
ncbi:hypothetical protein C4D60_Mb11t18620 [Musa balbisiana]|uniref:Uncharacterized protein n=1 Tax=Musa balbisiana TaxID=52838 RepID=A0A4S8J540_MUSBA|nr:hypothetical protein C4D60_Mb11t18620 [Musa balbisiana]